MATTIRTAILASAALVAGAAVGIAATLALTPAPAAPAPIVHVVDTPTPAPSAPVADAACRDAVDLLVGMHDAVHVELVNVILADLYAGTPRDWTAYEGIRAELGNTAEASVWPVVRECMEAR